MSGCLPYVESLLSVYERFQLNPLLYSPEKLIDSLSTSISLGAFGDGKADPSGLPSHKSGTPNGFPACPGKIALDGLK